MSIDAIASPNNETLENNASYLFENEVAQTIASIWNRIFSFAATFVSKIYYISRSVIGVPVRDFFFFPLYFLDVPLIKNFLAESAAQLEIEEAFSSAFWDDAHPLDLNFPIQSEIRAKFASRDHTFSIETEDGRPLTIASRVIETKNLAPGEKAAYTFVFTPGIFGTCRTQAATMYPYLAAFLKERGENTPSARFIILSENDIKQGDLATFFRPSTIEEAGNIYYRGIQAIRKEFGNIDQLNAHSLGGLFAASSFKHFKHEDELPAHICLDRTLTSIWEISKRKLFPFGWMFYPLMRWVGWTIDVDQEIANLCTRTKKPSILIAGVKQDHHFQGKANLCLASNVQALKKAGRIQVAYFDLPRQLVHVDGHHSAAANVFHGHYLKKTPAGPELIDMGKRNLAEWIIHQ